MFTLEQFAQIAAIVSAMSDVIGLGKETFENYLRRREEDPATARNAAILAKVFSFYSDEELEAIRKRILNCRDRFIREGAGEQRRICLCSVFQDVKDGNGGTIPIDDWNEAYERYGCAA